MKYHREATLARALTAVVVFLLSIAARDVCLVSASPLPASERLTDSQARAMFDGLLPQGQELSYRDIPWRHTVMEAVIEAHQSDKPILLWMMQGHPLGFV